MGRILFSEGKQKVWIEKIIEESELSTTQLAEICDVSPRTFKDWSKGKFTISERALCALSKTCNIPIPPNTKLLPDFWYVTKGARKGALKRLQIYGPLGDVESRKKGGLVSQQRRREDPSKYKLLGCNVRKVFKEPIKDKYLAELVGVILGDGGITFNQLTITLDRKTDRDYAVFVNRLLKRVFGEEPTRCEYRSDNCILLRISGVDLIDRLRGLGLEKGDKVARQVDLPKWIWSRTEFKIACIRGLMDTDGGLYFHRHWTGGIKYRNLGICFTSNSRPLLLSVFRILTEFGIKSFLKENRIYVYSLQEIKDYFKIFSSDNPKHGRKLEYHLENSKILAKIFGEVA